jgi:hypothetical protein
MSRCIRGLQGYFSPDVPEGERNTTAPASLRGQAIAHLAPAGQPRNCCYCE